MSWTRGGAERRITAGVQLLARACGREAPRSKRVPVCCNAGLCGRRPHERGSLVGSDGGKDRGQRTSAMPLRATTRADQGRGSRGNEPEGSTRTEGKRASEKPGSVARKGGAVVRRGRMTGCPEEARCASKDEGVDPRAASGSEARWRGHNAGMLAGPQEEGREPRSVRGGRGATFSGRARPRGFAARSQERPSVARTDQDARTCDAIDEFCSSAA